MEELFINMLLFTFKLALKSIMRNKSRTFLTMLGIIIGVSSVVLLTSIGTGLKIYIEQQFQSLGSNTIYVAPGNPLGASGGPTSQAAVIERSKRTLKKRYLNQVLRENRDLIRSGVASLMSSGTAKYKTKEEKATFYGAMTDYAKITHLKLKAGRWFAKDDDQRSRRVVVLGNNIGEKLFGTVDPVGKKIKLSSKSYRVIGVLESRGGGFGGPSWDDFVYLPFATLSRDFNIDTIKAFLFQAKDKTKTDETIKAIKKTLLKSMTEDDFSVFDQTQILSTVNGILNVLTLGLGGIAAISLLVGGIGIMNIMLVSVTERTREIGLRKAIGATPNLIMLQFLIEAILLSVIGGLIGLVLAYVGSLLIKPYFPAQVTWQAVILAFGVSTVVGLIFGVMPAKRAAKLSPIEALRYE